MPYTSDTNIDILDNNVKVSTYIISSAHRKVGNKNKSVWTLDFNGEVDCFTTAITKSWRNGQYGWGFKLGLNNVFEEVGRSADDKELKLAKFVDGNSNNVWHGYPADYLKKSQDRPTTVILKNWVDSGFLTKSKMTKIRKGQVCNL
jgi:hypothetical protein